MKTHRIQWLLALMAATSTYAKPPKDGGDRRPPPVPPWFAMLDTNRDKVLSDEEIKAAADIISQLDKNNDGEVTLDELRMPPPPPPEGENGGKNPPPGGKPPHPPVIAALDTDHDGTISAQEMENAPESLKTLDKDGDGELSPEELHPHGPPPRAEGDEQGPPPAGGPPVE